MAQNYYQKEIETMPVEEMKKLQSEKLVKQVKHVYENVEYYRNLMDEKGVKPEDIKGIAVPVLAHRIMFSASGRANFENEIQFIEFTMNNVEVPVR